MKNFLNQNQRLVLAILTLGTCFILITIVLLRTSEKDVQMFIVGALLTIVTSILGYYFGASRDSKTTKTQEDVPTEK